MSWKTWIMIFYLFVLALVFIILPWTRLWEVSVFAKTGGLATRIYMSMLFRSMITALGALSLLSVVEEIARVFWGKEK